MTQDYLHRLGLLLFASVWSSNWPLFVLPLIAWMIGRKALPFLDRMATDPIWQQRMAIHLSCLPGLVMISLGFSATLGLRHAEIDSLLCIVVFLGPVLICSFAMFRAMVLLAGRRRVLDALRDETIPASRRLQSLADEIRVPVRELPDSGFACMVAGVFRPIVIISTGTVESLTDEEIQAVLLHERAHLKRRDTLFATLVTFIAECGFWPTDKVLGVYRRSREILADQLACRDIDRLLLASVLIRFARGFQHHQLNFIENFAERSSVSERVKLLIEDEPQVYPSPFRLRVGFVVTVASTLVLYPLLVRMAVVMWLHCP
jgi:beta-lactamase regulating signal transducer with metallopeptidase domain